MNTCVAYARVSTDSKDQENSFENQKSYFENKLRNTEGYEFCCVYADKGLTGTKLNNRPEFNQMLRDAGIDIIETFTSKDRRLKKKHVLYEETDREPKFDEIWIKNTSRFARNTLSFEIIKKLRNKGVHIYFVEQSLNTKDVGSDFLLKLFQLFDEQESRDKSLKVSSGIREGARKGIISTNSKLHGYIYNQPENRLEIIPEEAEEIRLIFRLYSEDYGIRRIINQLDERGITTRHGKSFSKSSIHNILTNEKYAGRNVRMKYTAGSIFNKESSPKLRPEEERIEVITDKIPAIITKELFDQCQEILRGKVNHKSQVGLYKGTTEFAGLLVCGKCGSPYISNVDKGRRFYNCSTKKQHGTTACDNKNITLDTLHLYDSNRHVIMKGGFIQVGLTTLQTLAKNCRQGLEKIDYVKIRDLQKQLQSNKEEIMKLTILFTKEKIMEEIYDELSKSLNEQHEKLKLRIARLTEPREVTLAELENYNKSIEKLKNEEIKEYYTNEEILSEINEITIYPDNRMKISLKIAHVEVPQLNDRSVDVNITYEK